MKIASDIERERASSHRGLGCGSGEVEAFNMKVTLRIYDISLSTLSHLLSISSNHIVNEMTEQPSFY